LWKRFPNDISTAREKRSLDCEWYLLKYIIRKTNAADACFAFSKLTASTAPINFSRDNKAFFLCLPINEDWNG